MTSNLFIFLVYSQLKPTPHNGTKRPLTPTKCFSYLLV